MYDTITIFYENDNIFGLDKYLSNPVTTTNNQTGETITTGNIKNLRCKVNSNGVLITGSLPKFHYGDNISLLTRKETEKAILNLCDGLHLDLKNAYVYRLDISNNIIVNEKVSCYFSSFGSMGKYSRLENGKTTLEYRINKTSFLLYDKIKQVKKQKGNIPEPFVNKNLLRIEMQFKKQPYTTMKMPKFTLDKLPDEKFYMSTIKHLKKMYYSIDRINNDLLPIEDFENMDIKDFMNFLMALGLKNINENELMRILNNAYKNGNISATQKSRFMAKIKAISKNPKISKPNNLIQELDKKFENSLKHYR